MKQIFAIAAGMLAFVFTMCYANAAPTAVRDANSAITYGTTQALAIEKDTSAGYNRVAVKYASGWLYVADDAAWSRFAAFQAGLTNPVTANNGRVYDIAKATVGCNGSQSYVAWPNVGQPDLIADNCALRQAAVAASQ